MPNAKPGYAIKRIAGDLEDYALASGERLADIISDLLDGDSDTAEALENAVWMALDTARLLRIMTLIAREKLTDAEMETVRLVARDRKQAK
jgi:hypothetical protein